jgi:hypothetical protein
MLISFHTQNKSVFNITLIKSQYGVETCYVTTDAVTTALIFAGGNP